jgi:sugar phosphate isomerase/epimerase
MDRPRIGVQLIVFGELQKTNLGHVMAAVAQAKYDGAEVGMPADQQGTDRMRAALQSAGIALMGAHSGFVAWDDPDVVSHRISAVKSLGGRFVISSGRFETLEEYRNAARLMNDVGKQCLDAGLAFCYHNHAWEFNPIDGTKPIHLIAAETDPELVKFCPDVYWVDVGGEKPAEFIARYADRCPCFHFKDGLGGDQYREFRELGQGNVDLPAALKAALACNPEWIVVEQDTTKLDPAESAAVSREYLKSLGV